MALSPIPILSKPGIKRDGTLLEGENYIDGQWCRFQRGLPRKIGGYKLVDSLFVNKIYGMRVDLVNTTLYAHLGSSDALTQVRMTDGGVLLGQSARTPAGFTPDANHLWQMDAFYDSTAGIQQLIAHAGTNLGSIADTTESPIYAGDLTDSVPLVATGMDPVSGGVLALGPYLMAYGNNGRVDWTAANNFSVTAASSFVAPSKIVKALPLRGTGGGPGAILWSLDSVIRATFNDPAVVTFAFDTLTSESSILSSQCVIEYDGIFYWIGIDRFLMFNGVVREVPNNTSINWFLDNLNFSQRQKVFATKVTRFGEIWWCFPFGDATECTHAIIYNVRENSWYDTQLPTGMRTAASFPKVYPKPFMVDATLRSGYYSLWQHETGVDQDVDGTLTPIPSHFQTGEVTMLDQGLDQAMHVGRLEPDFVQSGTMMVAVYGRANAKCEEIVGEQFPIAETPDPADPQSQVVGLRVLHRLMSFKFSTNTTGGDYQMGKIYGFVDKAGGRFTK